MPPPYRFRTLRWERMVASRYCCIVEVTSALVHLSFLWWCCRNYAATIQIQDIAVREKGCQQVLWLYGEDHIMTEVGTMNLFVYLINKDGGPVCLFFPLLFLSVFFFLIFFVVVVVHFVVMLYSYWFKIVSVTKTKLRRRKFGKALFHLNKIAVTSIVVLSWECTKETVLWFTLLMPTSTQKSCNMKKSPFYAPPSPRVTVLWQYILFSLFWCCHFYWPCLSFWSTQDLHTL